MSQAAPQEDWRKKYFDSMRAVEDEARQSQVRLHALYHLAGRLCSAAQDRSPRIDTVLKPLREALRRQAGATELEALDKSLTEAVRELIDSVGVTGVTSGNTSTLRSVPASSADPRLRDALTRVLADLRQVPDLAGPVESLQASIAQSPGDDKLAGALEQAGAMLLKRIRTLEKERDGLQILLDQMVGQLDMLNIYFRSSAEEESRRNSSHDTLNLQVTGEVQAIGASIQDGNDLDQLRQQLTNRLSAIGRHMQDFREREEEHARRSSERAARMQARMAEMETEAKELQARLSDEQRQSLTDTLTRIPNRAAWDQRIEEELRRWEQNRQPVCVLAWDIDAFKAINDRYGHRAGDKVLVVVAESLATGVRGTDFVARYGGEEFMMVLPGTSLANGVVIADQMREAITGIGFHFRGAPLVVTISCGITELIEGDTAASAYDRADQALYKAKNGGRNRVVTG